MALRDAHKQLARAEMAEPDAESPANPFQQMQRLLHDPSLAWLRPLSDLLVELEKRGVERRKAYDIIQRSAMKVWKNNENFKAALWMDKDFMKVVKPKELEKFFDLGYYTKHVGNIFRKVGI